LSELLEIRLVVESIQNAFRPLRCGIEIFDFERKLRFRVFDVDGRPVLNMSKMLTRRARDPTGLRLVVMEARAHVESKGFKLEPWAPPG
jgi:hypothetical protein